MSAAPSRLALVLSSWPFYSRKLERVGHVQAGRQAGTWRENSEGAVGVCCVGSWLPLWGSSGSDFMQKTGEAGLELLRRQQLAICMEALGWRAIRGKEGNPAKKRSGPRTKRCMPAVVGPVSAVWQETHQNGLWVWALIRPKFGPLDIYE